MCKSTFLDISAMLFLFIVAAAAVSTEGLAGHAPTGMIHRQHSVMKPYLVGDSMAMPFWGFIGNAVVTDDYIRLTPDRQSKRGAIWSTMPVPIPEWEVTVHFKIHGQGKSLFGDGFAMWYTKDRNSIGDVFGSKDHFTGLGIFFDTYSNMEMHRSGGGAYISAMVNDGTIDYDHDKDGTHQQLASCNADIRNRDHDTYFRVLYRQRTLKVELDVDGSGSWTPCFFVADVFLPKGYFFGVSAATGDLADNHDIISFVVSNPPPMTDDDIKSMKNMETEDAAKVADIPQKEADVEQPFAARHEPPRAHVGPPRKKMKFNAKAFKRIRHQAGDVNVGASQSAWWMYFALAAIAIIGLALVIYKIKVVDKRNAQRFSF